MDRPDIAALLSTLYHPGLKTIEPGLERVLRLMDALGNPHLRLPPVIHIAGTNGKGSLVAYLQAIFEAAEMRVHRYISPHLVRFNERIVIGGQIIDDDRLFALLQRVKEVTHTHPATFFETTTAAAFLAFADTPADIVLLETGMGGRLDATNIIPTPLLTAITPISLDHTEYLGDSLQKIAFEKAGIMRHGIPCVVGPQTPEALQEIERVAHEKQNPLYRYDYEWFVDSDSYRSTQYTLPFSPSLPGVHQSINAATAIACIEVSRFSITDSTIARGIACAIWPGRLQLLHGTLAQQLPNQWELWLDGGHNPAAGKALAEWAKERQDKPLILICGMVKGKDSEGFLTPLSPYVRACIAIGIPEEPASQPAENIHEYAKGVGMETYLAKDITSALREAINLSNAPTRILITGSLYLAGKVLAIDTL